MIEMARASRPAGIGPEYNNFLYATICADANGSLLSVLSAMARMNLDPWQEAANLAGLPAKAAARRLATLITAIPDGPALPDETGLIAVRLVKLLPSQTRSVLPSLPLRKGLPDIGALARSQIALYMLLVLIALALATMWFNVQRPPSASPDTAHVSATTAPRNTPPSH